jgi:hypothetical protein
MFGCDDVVFKGAWDPREVMVTFQRLPNLLAFSLRLGKEITYCYPVNRDMSPPDFLKTVPFLVWRWPQGELDWGYPWELDCSIYSKHFVRSMLRALDKRGLLPWRRWGNPNRLEGLGARLVRQMINLDLMAAYPAARASVVTINIVQERYPTNRVYQENIPVEVLLEKWNSGIVLDIDHYVDRPYRSIHIGDVSFAHRSGEADNGPTA